MPHHFPQFPLPKNECILIPWTTQQPSKELQLSTAMSIHFITSNQNATNPPGWIQPKTAQLGESTYQPPSIVWIPNSHVCFPYQPPILQGRSGLGKIKSRETASWQAPDFPSYIVVPLMIPLMKFGDVNNMQLPSVSYLPGVDGAANVASLSDPISCKCHHNDQTFKNMFSKKTGWSFKCNKYII